MILLYIKNVLNELKLGYLQEDWILLVITLIRLVFFMGGFSNGVALWIFFIQQMNLITKNKTTIEKIKPNLYNPNNNKGCFKNC